MKLLIRSIQYLRSLEAQRRLYKTLAWTMEWVVKPTWERTQPMRDRVTLIGLDIAAEVAAMAEDNNLLRNLRRIRRGKNRVCVGDIVSGMVSYGKVPNIESKRSLGLVIEVREVHRDPLVNDLMGNYEGLTFANEGLVLWFDNEAQLNSTGVWRSGYHLEVVSMINTVDEEE